MSLRIQEQDDLKNKLSAFIEEKEKAKEGDGLIEEQHNMKETALSSDQEESKIVSVPEALESVKNSLDLSSVGQIQTLQVCLRM